MHLSPGIEGSMIGKLLFLSLNDPFLPSRDMIATGHHSQLPIALLLLVICATAIVFQYARRRTGISRLILLVLPVALTLLVLATAHGSGPARPFTDPTYAPLAAGAAPPVELAYAPSAKRQIYVSKGGGPVSVTIPIGVSGIAADAAVIAGPYPKVTITGADGYTWNGNASEFYPEKMTSTSRWVREEFNVPRAMYDRLKVGPVTIGMSLALTELQATRWVRIPMPASDVMVPGYGVCGRMDVHHAMLTCRAALREPQLTYASADWSATPCPAAETELEQVRGDPWMGMADTDPAEFGISPIMFTGISFTPDLNNATGGKYLCSGSMITLTQYRVVKRVQTESVMKGFQLPGD